jgi:hypothetical protein
MKTGIVSSIHAFAHGFASSYTTALSSMRGINGKMGDDGFSKSSVNLAVIENAAESSDSIEKTSEPGKAGKIDLVA